MTNISASTPTPSVHSSLPNSGSEPLTEAAATHFQTADRVDSEHIVTQQFLSFSSWGHREYQADMRYPSLIPPDEGSIGPFEPAWQKETNKFFRNRLLEILMKKNKEAISSSPEQFSKECAEQVNRILQTIAKGEMATLSQEDQESIVEATKQTQEAWSLPSTWTFGTQQVQDWTPTKIDIEPPADMSQARGQVLADNVITLSASIEEAANKILGEIPADNPNHMAVNDLIKVITQVIAELKYALQNMQVQEAKISSKFSQAKFEQNQDRKEQVEAAIEKQKKVQKKQKKQRKIANTMRIVAPVVAAVTMVATLAVIASTAGLATPLFIASAIVSSILFSYTVVDSQMGLTQQGFESFNVFLQNRIEQEWAQDLVKAAILTILMLILVLAVVASGGSTASSIGAAIAEATIEQMAIQGALMLIMASNILPEVVVNTCIRTGAIDEDDAETQMIVQMIAMALTLLLCLEIAAGGKGPLSSLFNAFKGGQTSAQAAMEANKAALKSAQGMINEADSVANPLQDTLDGLIDMINILPDKTASTATNWGRFAKQLEDIFRISGLGVEAGYSIYSGLISIQIAQLFRQLGRVEEAQEMIQILIKLFEGLLNSYQEGIATRGEWINNLNQIIDNAHLSQSRISTKVTQQYLA